MRMLSMMLLVPVTIIFGAALIGVPISTLYVPSSLVIVFGPLVLYLTFALGFENVWGWCLRILGNKTSISDRLLLENLGNLGFLFGTIAMIIGLIHMFQNLADTSRIGAGVAVAIVGGVYGTLPAIFGMMVSRTPLQRLKSKTKTYTGTVFGLSFFILGFVLYALTRTSIA